MVELERRGIPTVVFTAQHFVPDARRSALSFGLSGLPLAVAPLPFTNQRPEDVHRMAEAAVDQVVAGRRGGREPWTEGVRPVAEERLVYAGDDLLDAWDKMNRDFVARGWSDGFPL